MTFIGAFLAALVLIYILSVFTWRGLLLAGFCALIFMALGIGPGIFVLALLAALAFVCYAVVYFIKWLFAEKPVERTQEEKDKMAEVMAGLELEHGIGRDSREYSRPEDE
ncbi:MAG: hypothetical protein AAB804_01820 [Patescibacteria group bacterium]